MHELSLVSTRQTHEKLFAVVFFTRFKTIQSLNGLEEELLRKYEAQGFFVMFCFL